MKNLTLIVTVIIFIGCAKKEVEETEFKLPSWAVEVDSVISNYNKNAKVINVAADTLPNGLEYLELYATENGIEKIYVKTSFKGYHFESILYVKNDQPYFSEVIGMQPLVKQRNQNMQSGVATLFKERYYFDKEEMQLKLKKLIELATFEDYEVGRKQIDTMFYALDSVDDVKRSFFQVGQMYGEIKKRIIK
ncbi:hypothetical protein KH5_11630 [Urechidicola sp. KH5]